MNKTHKGHSIVVSASRLAATPRQWKPCLTIIWSEDGEGRVSKLTVDRAFRDRREAEMEEFLFAKKWIDNGKPDLLLNLEPLDPTFSSTARPEAKSHTSKPGAAE